MALVERWYFMKSYFLFILVLILASCGRNDVVMEPSSMGIVESLIKREDSSLTKMITEKECIDDLLVNEMNEKEKVRKVVTDTDINFCNGSRLRLKIFKMNDTKLRVYGFAETSTGEMSCLRDGDDFKKVFLKGHEGTLTGEGIKISLGGHLYKDNKKLIKSENRKVQYVTFKDTAFQGDIGLFVNNELLCNEAPSF